MNRRNHICINTIHMMGPSTQGEGGGSGSRSTFLYEITNSGRWITGIGFTRYPVGVSGR